MTTALPLRCRCRRHEITSLRCARCNVPICPHCSVVAPAGQLCRECASGRKSRLYQVGPKSLALAILACLATAVLGGWLLASLLMGFGFFVLWFSYLYGLIIAEVALRVTGRKRGPLMEILAGTCAAVGILAGWLFVVPAGSPEFISALGRHLFQPWSLLVLGLAIFAAVTRIRYF